jgi:predicted ATPase
MKWCTRGGPTWECIFFSFHCGPGYAVPVRRRHLLSLARMRRIVITGGPGTGKTTLLAALRARGYRAVDESARTIIQERLAGGLSPRPPALEFARHILHRDIAKYEQPTGADLVFFDRSIVEALCMVDQAARLEAHELRDLLSRYPYDRRVFVLPPWEAIYTTDSERDQTFAEALRVHETLTEWYRRCEYEIIEVPPGAVVERCDHVLRALANRDA